MKEIFLLKEGGILNLTLRWEVIKMDELNNLRKKVDKLDSELLNILKRRLILSKEISRFKRKNGLKILDKKREKEVLQNKIKKSSLNGRFVKELFSLILCESRRIQK